MQTNLLINGELTLGASIGQPACPPHAVSPKQTITALKLSEATTSIGYAMVAH